MNEVTVGNDGAFSEDLLAERYTTDLANGLGNLWFRFASMLEKYFDKKVPQAVGGDFVQGEAFNLRDRVDEAMLSYDPRTALSKIWQVVTLANQTIEEKKPWVLAKDPSKKNELASVMVTLVETLAHLAAVLQIFLPQTAAQILNRLNLAREVSLGDSERFRRPLVPAGVVIERGEALFPRLEEKETA